jgi:hypothetical protein
MLCAWAAYRLSDNPNTKIKKIKGETMETYLQGIRSYHVDRRWDVSIFTSPSVKRIIQGSYNLFGRWKSPRYPITREALAAITEDYPLTKVNLNLRSCFLLAFVAFLRMGEVTYDSKHLANRHLFVQQRVTRSCIRFSPTGDHMQLTIPRSKTDKKNQGTTIIIAAVASPLCAVKAMIELFAKDPQPSDAPLFSFDGAPFTKDRLNHHLRQRLVARGLSTEGILLHSFRKGAAQHAMDSGMREDQVQLLGRWTSEAFRKYFTTSRETYYATSFLFQTGCPLPFATGYNS